MSRSLTLAGKHDKSVIFLAVVHLTITKPFALAASKDSGLVSATCLGKWIRQSGSNSVAQIQQSEVAGSLGSRETWRKIARSVGGTASRRARNISATSRLSARSHPSKPG